MHTSVLLSGASRKCYISKLVLLCPSNAMRSDAAVLWLVDVHLEAS
jgi:hypothetical protein